MKIKDFDKLVFGLASPEDILSWSYGEVKKPETINYRTFKPERDGLFCEKIFGPVKDYECHCGKYKGQRYEGITCDRCGVTVTKSSVRRERMGHIKLAVPVVHIWYFKNVPNYIGLLLNISSKQLEEVIYYHSYIVLDPGDTPLQKMQVLTEEEYEKAYSDFGDGFKVGMGAEAIKKLLKELDLEELSFDLKKQIEEIQGQKRAKLIKRLEIVESFRLSGNKPEWMVLEVLPVIPPDLRPMVQLEGGKFATSDLNDLYRRVINRNNRLAKLLEINAPEIIVRNEKRMLQEAVDALIDNGRRGKPVTNASGRALRSLSDILEGKQGRFRQNLLGKRVDFSGRAVIVVGPELKLHQCGLPKKMALELFKPFVINKLIEHGYATNVKNARKKIERETSEVWDVLDEIIKEKLVLLNRAPTLHRVSIQAFEPKLIDGNAIQLHPLVCPPYNADFDGDQMAVHVPLSIEAQAEARILMLSANNLISPAHGKPLTLPTQDVVLGVYYLTLMVPGREVEDKRFATPEEVLLALENKKVDLHSKVYVHKKGMEETYNISLPDQPAFIETTPGRLILNEIVPEKLRYYNVTLNRREVRKIVEKCFEVYGWSKTAEFLDELKRLGFEYATKAGVSFSIVDIEIPKEAKEKVIKKAEEESTLLQKAVESGLYSEEERYHRAIEIWTKATEEVKDIMLANFDILNSVYMMAFSGARGNVDQVRQLAAMRGLMADPSGQIMDIPIKSSFYEGLTVSEHFISSYGARKGVVDTALRTSDSGYLTRRLVDVAQSLVIREEDCGTDDGIYVEALEDEGKIVLSLKDRIIGRFAAEDVYNDKGELIIAKNEYIDVEKAKLVEKFGIKRVKIRSPMTCKSEKGICQKCYGEDLATHRLVNIGEAVGVIAAQSIGEPGTQLTMRTFHTGGVALTSLNYQNIQFRVTGKVDFVDLKFRDRFEVLGKREKMVVGRNGKVVVKGDGQEEEIIIPPGAIISIEPGSDVTKGMSLGYIDPNLRYITSPYSGKVVRVEKVLENRSKRFNLVNVRYNRDINKYELSFNEETHTVFCSVVLLDQSGNEHRMELPEGATFLFRIGDLIDEGDLIAEYSRETMKIQSCEDGKVVNILERNGEIIDKIVATGEAVVVVRNNDGKEIEYRIPRGLKLHVNVGDHVEFGTILAYFPSYQQRTAKTEDIVQGLPRVEELFEARRPKGKSIIAGVSGIVRITRTKSGEKIIIEGEDGSKDEHILPPNAQLLVKEGDYVTVGQELTKGYRNPAEILANEGLAAVQRYIVDEVQKVYLKQGAEINDKHIEVIVRQMTNRVRIEDPGDSNFLFGQLVNKVTFEKVKQKLEEEGKRPPVAREVVLGITKAALTTESVISAASFQETTRVLAEAAVKGKEDYLEGLKENVIIGRLIPAGTGLFKRIVPQKRTAKKVEVLEDGGEVEINS